MANFSKKAKSGENIIEKLQNIKIGGGSQAVKVKKRDMIFILRNVTSILSVKPHSPNSDTGAGHPTPRTF